MTRYIIVLLFTITALVWCTSCGSDVQQSFTNKPLAFGKLNHINVLMEDNLWNSPAGDTLLYYYASAYPILPQPEPRYDLRHFTYEDLEKDPIRRELRTFYIAANLSDENSPISRMVREDLGEENMRRARENNNFRTLVGKNKWASNQLVVYQFAFSADELANVIRRGFPQIQQRVEDAQAESLEATVYQPGENAALKRAIEQQYGAQIRIPGDYVMAVHEGEFMWLRRETREYSNNLMIYRLPYTDPAQLTKPGLKAIRDSLGRRYISTEVPGTFMQINDVDLPLITEVSEHANRYVIEGRGIWEIENDFMGGSFVSYLIHNSDKDSLLFIDGFVHAPGKEKRDQMVYLTHILDTVEF